MKELTKNNTNPTSTYDSKTPQSDQPNSGKEPRYSDSNHSADSSSSSFQIDLVSFRICQIIVPVTLCSLYVVISIRILEWGTGREGNVIGKAWDRLGLGVSQDLTFSETLLNNTIIVGIFVVLIAIVTLVILFVFYMEWHNCLSYYFYIPSFIIMAILTPVYFKEILEALNWFALDSITMVILTWNFVALGMVAIFNIYTKSPLFVQQFYLIHDSAILAVIIIKTLPSWAPWMLLIFLVFWDLFAVLAPYGPLNLIISMAEREGIIEMPGLVYATDVTQSQQVEQQQQQQTTLTAKQQGNKSTVSDVRDQAESQSEGNINKEGLTRDPEAVARRQLIDQQAEGEEASRGEVGKRKSIQEKGVNIGLGDFIFYSLLIGLNAKGRQMGDFYTILASLDAILVGLILTLVILAVTRRALPALPISIALGLIISMATNYFVPNLCNQLAAEQIFI